jgi:hypothetical protein
MHAYAWRQGPGQFKSRRGSWPSWGFLVRVRDPRGTKRWRHVRARIGWRGLSEEGRGVLQAEVDTWLTEDGTWTRGSRPKMYVRVRCAR